MTKYEVRFVCYQYNGGGSIQNGMIPCKGAYSKLEEAQEFAQKIRSLARSNSSEAPEGSRDFASKYVWDGYVERLDGIYKITEEKVG